MTASSRWVPWSLAALTLAGSTAWLAVQLDRERELRYALLDRVGTLETQLAARSQPPVPPGAPGAAGVAPLPEGRGPPGPRGGDPPPGPPGGARAATPAPVVAPPVDPAFVEASTGMVVGVGSQRPDAATRDALRRQQRLAMRRMYPDLAKSLDLSAEDAARFLDAVIEQNLRVGDEGREWRATGASAGSAGAQALRRRLEDLRRESETDLASRFGEDTMRRWRSYQESAPARMEVRNLQLELLDAGMPLDESQRQRMLDAYVAEQRTRLEAARTAAATASSSGPATAGAATPWTRATGAGADSSGAAAQMQRAVTEAEQRYQRLRSTFTGILTAEQLARFDENQQAQLDMQRAMLQTARARRAGADGSTPR
jgi:hypothetical protein